jgi:hypothetical protein
MMANRAGANSKESCLDFLSVVRVILPTLSYRALSEEEEEEFDCTQQLTFAI